jgi:hypothetical protein
MAGTGLRSDGIRMVTRVASAFKEMLLLSTRVLRPRLMTVDALHRQALEVEVSEVAVGSSSILTLSSSLARNSMKAAWTS